MYDKKRFSATLYSENGTSTIFRPVFDSHFTKAKITAIYRYIEREVHVTTFSQ